jgi:hypothetical protein
MRFIRYGKIYIIYLIKIHVLLDTWWPLIGWLFILARTRVSLAISVRSGRCMHSARRAGGLLVLWISARLS